MKREYFKTASKMNNITLMLIFHSTKGSIEFFIELFKVGGSSAMQLSNQSDTSEVLYNLFLRIKTSVPL